MVAAPQVKLVGFGVFRSPWDVLHPGRQFAEKLATGGTTQEILVTRLKEYFAGQVVPLVPTEEAILVRPRTTMSDRQRTETML
jgi:hypothetical protein